MAFPVDSDFVNRAVQAEAIRATDVECTLGQGLRNVQFAASGSGFENMLDSEAWIAYLRAHALTFRQVGEIDSDGLVLLVAGETNRAINAETTIRNFIDSEVTRLMFADSDIRLGLQAEASTRAAIDQIILGQISVITDSEIPRIDTVLYNAQNAFASNDNPSQLNLNRWTQFVRTVQSYTASGGAAIDSDLRTNPATTALPPANVDNWKSFLDLPVNYAPTDYALASTLSTEISNRTTQDTQLQASISALTNTVNTNATAARAYTNASFDSEARLRAAADNNLQAGITAEASARAIGDTNLGGLIDTTNSNLTNTNNTVSQQGTRITALEMQVNSGAGGTLVGRVGALETRAGTDSDRLTNEISRATGVETNLQAQLSAEVTARTNADNDFNTRLLAETTRAINSENAIANTISTEVSRAIIAEAQLQTNITNLRTDIRGSNSFDTIATLRTAITAETTRATNREDDIIDRLDSEAAQRDLGDYLLGVRIDSEIENRTVGDNNLNTRVTTLTGNVTAGNPTNLAAETLARQQADSALGNRIDAANARIDSEHNRLSIEIARATGVEAGLQTQLNTEITNRTNADNALRARLDSETAVRISSDSTLSARIDSDRLRINTEISNRITADNALGVRINTDSDRLTTQAARLDGRINTDSDRLTTEIARAIAAEAALNNRADSERTARRNADSDLNARINTANSIGDSERMARIAADNALGVRINTDSDRLTSQAARLDGRINADSDRLTTQAARLDGRINADSDRLSRVDSDSRARDTLEISVRTAADNALGARINADSDRLTAEANTRRLGDSEVRQRVIDETARAINVEGVLTLRADSERTARRNADTALTARLNADSDYLFSVTPLAALGNKTGAFPRINTLEATVGDNSSGLVRTVNTLVSTVGTTSDSEPQNTIYGRLYRIDSDLNTIASEIVGGQITPGGLTALINSIVTPAVNMATAGIRADLGDQLPGDSDKTAFQLIDSERRIRATSFASLRGTYTASSISDLLGAGYGGSKTVASEVTRLDIRINADSDRQSRDSDKLASNITRLDGRINTDSDRLTAQVVRLNADSDRLATQVARLDGRISADSDRLTTQAARLDGRINTDSDRLTNEIARATAAESALNARADSELRARRNADSDLGARITNLSTGSTAALDSEIAARKLEDSDIREYIAINTSNIRSLDSDLEVETLHRIQDDLTLFARTAADSDRLSRVDSDSRARDTSEASTRASADAALNARASADSDRLTNEITRATSAEVALGLRINADSDRLTNEITRATTAEVALYALADSERMARSSADSDIQAALGVVTNTVSGNFTTLNNRITSVIGGTTPVISLDSEHFRALNVENEIVTRANADSDRLTQEITNRTNAITALRGGYAGDINSLSTAITRIDGASTVSGSFRQAVMAEAFTRSLADSDLSNRIDANAAAVAANTARIDSDVAEINIGINMVTSGLNTEVTARSNADSDIRDSISALQASTTSSITTINANILAANNAIDSERLERIAADNSEASARATGDQTVTSAFQAADAVLSSRINADSDHLIIVALALGGRIDLDSDRLDTATEAINRIDSDLTNATAPFNVNNWQERVRAWQTTYTASNATPLVADSDGLPGTSIEYSRADHVHPAPSRVFNEISSYPTGIIGFLNSGASPQTLLGNSTVFLRDVKPWLDLGAEVYILAGPTGTTLAQVCQVVSVTDNLNMIVTGATGFTLNQDYGLRIVWTVPDNVKSIRATLVGSSGGGGAANGNAAGTPGANSTPVAALFDTSTTKTMTLVLPSYGNLAVSAGNGYSGRAATITVGTQVLSTGIAGGGIQPTISGQSTADRAAAPNPAVSSSGVTIYYPQGLPQPGTNNFPYSIAGVGAYGIPAAFNTNTIGSIGGNGAVGGNSGVTIPAARGNGGWVILEW